MSIIVFINSVITVPFIITKARNLPSVSGILSNKILKLTSNLIAINFESKMIS